MRTRPAARPRQLVKPGYDSREVMARFESGAAAPRMDHGFIAKVLDAGADDLGRPYFVMEYVPGIAITDFADQNKLSIKQRLELFCGVCSAISHAHSKSIIHRDIKSSNVLAFYSEGKPVVKVIDFGIAKALSGDRLTDLTVNTRFGQPMGTYESMSPEQAEGSPDIDTRTDVYSLGALLYELLAGAAPFDRAVFAKSADQEIRRIIREVEPPRPCDRLTSMGIAGTKVALAARLRRCSMRLANEPCTELEWIPLMAMRKARERRYATPQEMADDIQRYLEHRPLRAGPETLNYVLRKNLRRHRVAVGATLAIFLSLAGGLAASSYLLVRAVGDEAVIKRAIAEIESAMAFGGDYETDHKDLISARRIHTNALDEMRDHNQTSRRGAGGVDAGRQLAGRADSAAGSLRRRRRRRRVPRAYQASQQCRRDSPDAMCADCGKRRSTLPVGCADGQPVEFGARVQQEPGLRHAERRQQGRNHRRFRLTDSFLGCGDAE